MDARVSKWFEAKDKQVGIDLFMELAGYSQAKKQVIASMMGRSGPTAKDRLLKEMSIIRDADLKADKPPITVENLQKRPSQKIVAKPAQPKTLPSIEQVPELLRPKLQRIKSIYPELNQLRGAIIHTLDVQNDQWRFKKAKRIVELNDELMELFAHVEHWNKTGELLEDRPMITLAKSDLLRMLRAWKGNQNYIRRYAKDAEKVDKVKQKQLELQSIEEFMTSLSQ